MAGSERRVLAYISCADRGEIAVLRLQADGRLTPLWRMALTEGGAPTPSSMPLTVSPDRRFMYAALRDMPHAVASFTIEGGTGELRRIGTAPLPEAVPYLATDRTGRHLFTASYGGAVVTSGAIEDGVVRAAPHQVIATPPKAHSIMPDAGNRHVYAACLGGDAILHFHFDAATGMLRPATPDRASTQPGAGPRHMAFHPGGHILYAINELDGTIEVFGINPSTGDLGRLQSLPRQVPGALSGSAAAADLHLTPNGRFLYGSERSSSTIALFRIDPADGTLTPGGTFPVERVPRGFAIDPAGEFLLSAGQESGWVTVHRIDPQNGRLELVSRVEVGAKPNWIEILEPPASV
jgi:6-phosphogluconolactonase